MSTVAEAALVPLLGRGRIHPWLHMDGEGICIGRVTDIGEYQLMTEEGTVLDVDQLKKLVTVAPRVLLDLAGRWSDADAESWIRDRAAPAFSDVLARLIHELRAAIEFPRPEHAALVAVWALGTYFHPVFLAYPRLALTGERASGKSKVLTILLAVSWNAMLHLTPTPAVLFRLAQAYRSALLLDEVEGLAKEEARELLAIINAGYKAGGAVHRVEGRDTRTVEPFAVYASMALAGIKGLNATTEDRCLRVTLQRGIDPARVNAEVDPGAPAFASIRAGAYRLLLSRWREVQARAATILFPDWLNARPRELWKPLLVLASIADEESNGLGIEHDLLALAREHIEDRDELSPEGEALLATLEARMNGSEAIVRPKDLTEPLRERLGWQHAPTPEQVGAWLRRFGFRRTGKDRDGARYHIGADQLGAVTARFSPPATVTPSPSRDK